MEINNEARANLAPEWYFLHHVLVIRYEKGKFSSDESEWQNRPICQKFINDRSDNEETPSDGGQGVIE